MKNKLQLLLFLTLSLLLCACAKETPSQATIPPTTAAPAQTEITLPEETETVPVTTEPTAPEHSPLYHPDYAPQQILEYFEEVVLNVEYSDGTGDSSLVQKWLAPISYRIDGAPTEEDLAVLDAFLAQLNEVPGFPGMYPAEGEEVEQLRISFLEPDVFRACFSSVVNGEDAFGATEFWYYTDTNEIHSARIGHRTDIAQRERSSILVEEIVNTLGISDTLLRSDSITYQYSNDNLTLSDVDWILVKLLYHPDIQCGMNREDCAAVIRQLYY